MNVAQYLLVSVWSLGHMRLVWAFGVESRQASVVLPCLQSCFEGLRALTGGSRPPILRMHSDKAREFLSPVIRTYLSQQGVRQTVNSGSPRQRPCRKVDWNCQSKSPSSRSRCSASTGILVLRMPMGSVRAYSSCHRDTNQQSTPTLWWCHRCVLGT